MLRGKADKSVRRGVVRTCRSSAEPPITFPPHDFGLVSSHTLFVEGRRREGVFGSPLVSFLSYFMVVLLCGGVNGGELHLCLLDFWGGKDLFVHSTTP